MINATDRIRGYERLIESLRDLTHTDHREHLDWLGLASPAEFDPDRFDASAVTKILALL